MNADVNANISRTANMLVLSSSQETCSPTKCRVVIMLRILSANNSSTHTTRSGQEWISAPAAHGNIKLSHSA